MVSELYQLLQLLNSTTMQGVVGHGRAHVCNMVLSLLLGGQRYSTPRPETVVKQYLVLNNKKVVLVFVAVWPKGLIIMERMWVSGSRPGRRMGYCPAEAPPFAEVVDIRVPSYCTTAVVTHIPGLFVVVSRDAVSSSDTAVP